MGVINRVILYGVEIALTEMPTSFDWAFLPYQSTAVVRGLAGPTDDGEQ